MIHIITLPASMLVAILRGGRFANIGSTQLHLGWLVIMALGLQLAVVYLPWLQTGGRYQLPADLMVLSYLMLLAGVIANHRLGGMWLLGLGLLLNFAVIVANGGFMPIAPDAARDLGLLPQSLGVDLGVRMSKSKDIILGVDQTALWMLSDIFVTSRYIPIKTAFSIGDVLSAIGLFLAIQRAMLPDRGTWRGGLAKTASRVPQFLRFLMPSI